MAKFVALYDKPEDVEGFEQHLREHHIPIVNRWPGIQDVRLTRFSSTPRGTDSPYHIMVEVRFASDEEMAAALRSKPGAESARDAKAMAERFGIRPTMLLGDDL